VDHEQCAECGFDGADVDDPALLEALRALGPKWSALLVWAGDELRTRPEPAVWSAIEYAAHSRDILALHAFGIEQALTVDEPAFPAIDAEALVEAAATTYGDADPILVSRELGVQASAMVDLADRVDARSWTRGITIGEDRSDVRALLEHALHDSSHHLADVERGIVQLRGGEHQSRR
jgi:hypothetical protein